MLLTPAAASFPSTARSPSPMAATRPSLHGSADPWLAGAATAALRRNDHAITTPGAASGHGDRRSTTRKGRMGTACLRDCLVSFLHSIHSRRCESTRLEDARSSVPSPAEQLEQERAAATTARASPTNKSHTLMPTATLRAASWLSIRRASDGLRGL